ncbi:hypothetical protein PLICRDRAFT_696234 [Plicaturopsis crispa FD-325 SS-3]|nr:hypothetical protein PLICRDRAFT_696234 [Plicaturopsis crispa FD-325 SS-3]
MYTTFKSPCHTIRPYTYTAKSWHELPGIAQHHLAQVDPTRSTVLDATPINPHGLYNTIDIQGCCRQLVSRFLRSLEGVDNIIVQKRHEALGLIGPAETTPGRDERDAERVWLVQNILMPERQNLVDEFALRFDALLWLEFESERGLDRSYDDDAVERDRMERDERIAPAIFEANRCLEALHRSVIEARANRERLERQAAAYLATQREIRGLAVDEMPQLPRDTEDTAVGMTDVEGVRPPMINIQNQWSTCESPNEEPRKIRIRRRGRRHLRGRSA